MTAKSKRYEVTLPNPKYDGKTCGVQFIAGHAFINERTISKFLGWTVDEVVDKMRKDFGYKVVREKPQTK